MQVTGADDGTTNRTADALRAAGDEQSAADIRDLDSASDRAEAKLDSKRSSLVERLIYGPLPSVDELQAGGRAAMKLQNRRQPVVEAALACLSRGEAFTADGKISSELRSAVSEQGGYGYTVPAEFGGAGRSYAALARVEELLAASGLGPLAVELSGQLTIGAGSVLGYANDEQKKTYLPLIADGTLIGFALTEVSVGVNAKKIGAYVEPDGDDAYRLFAVGACNKLWITSAIHGGILGVVARIGRDGGKLGLFVIELPDKDVGPDSGEDYEFRCEPSGVAAFSANYNSRLHFKNFPVSSASLIPADGAEVLFYCLRMGRCMLAAMSAGYQQMLAVDASHYALRRIGVGGRLIKHELPRLAIGTMLGGSMQARALAYLALEQDAAGINLAGLRDLTKSAAASVGVESMIACEHVLGGRSFDADSRVNAARINLHLFGVVEGEDNLIRMGMVRDVTKTFVNDYLGGLLQVLDRVNKEGQSLDGEQRILRLTPTTLLRHPRRFLGALAGVAASADAWGLAGWVLRHGAEDLLRMPLGFLPSSLLPRYQSLPAPLRPYARFAERKLRRLRWAYLGMGLIWQLELTRAQIPLQRFGLAIEHLVSMLAICHHAAFLDSSQQAVAVLQAQRLKEKYLANRSVSGFAEITRLRSAVAIVGDEVADGTSTMVNGIEAEQFAHRWD